MMFNDWQYPMTGFWMDEQQRDKISRARLH
jgi:hypothetical protein